MSLGLRPIRQSASWMASSASPRMRSRVFGILLGGVAAGQEAVVGVEGGVQQIEPVEFLKDHGVEQQRGGLRIAGMRRMKALKALDRARIVQVVEVLDRPRAPADRGSADWYAPRSPRLRLAVPSNTSAHPQPRTKDDPVFKLKLLPLQRRGGLCPGSQEKSPEFPRFVPLKSAFSVRPPEAFQEKLAGFPFRKKGKLSLL